MKRAALGATDDCRQKGERVVLKNCNEGPSGEGGAMANWYQQATLTGVDGCCCLDDEEVCSKGQTWI